MLTLVLLFAVFTTPKDTISVQKVNKVQEIEHKTVRSRAEESDRETESRQLNKFFSET